MKLTDIRIDAERQEKGEWVKDIPEMGDPNSEFVV